MRLPKSHCSRIREASWSAAVLCRFGMTFGAFESGRGLPHSKTLARLPLVFLHP